MLVPPPASAGIDDAPRGRGVEDPGAHEDPGAGPESRRTRPRRDRLAPAVAGLNRRVPGLIMDPIDRRSLNPYFIL
jgi:hypothetical protein